jgi:signal peptidase I
MNKTEEFIEKSIIIHGDKYDYSKVEYENAKKHITIICKTHGEFNQRPNGHLNGYGCTDCGIENNANRKRSNTVEFIKKAIIVHGDEYDYSKVVYINSHTEVVIICKKHGEFPQMPSKHLSGHGCHTCGIENNANRRRSNTDEFIKKAIEIHGDKYDYSKVIYINNRTEVVIICKIHGEFPQIPNSHLSGYGCKSCGIQKVSDNSRSNTDEFIKKAIIVHGDKYDYSNLIYEKALESVLIICKKHGEFSQIAASHLSGHGCLICGGSNKRNTKEFIEQSKKIHGDKYEYSNVEYINSDSTVKIICKEHGEFEQIASGHLSGHGCSTCAGKNITTSEWIERAREIHGDKYDYSNVEYILSKLRVTIICKEHGEFRQIASSHLIGQGCSTCSNLSRALLRRKTINDFIEESNKIHGEKYDYSKVIYINNRTEVVIICKIHGEFIIIPSKHIHRQQGCPDCQIKKQYSKPQIKYLNFMASHNSIHIQHAENDGEYIISNTKFKADGYCAETNTIYEFHGDYWHGNPKVFDSQDYNKTTDCTFGELYEKTLEREKMIKDLGYNLVVMWEYDWNKINKSIKTLQKNFKSFRFIKQSSTYSLTP